MLPFLRTLTLGLSALSLLSLAATAAPKYINPTGDEFPILAWYSIVGDDNITAERYNELRQAGVNLSFSHFNHNTDLDKALAACDGTGVKLILTSYDLVGDTEGTVKRYKDNPNVAGYFLRDEPTVKEFGTLRQFRDRVYAADSSHLVYLNLLPCIVPAKDLGTSNYDEYVQRFIDEVDLPMVSYDFYPIVEVDDSIFVRDTFFENFEIASRVCKANGRPLWTFCLATMHDPYPMPTAVHLRHEAFSGLAYGAQAIQYFTYWNPGTTTWNFRNAPIDTTGRRTPVWYLMRDLNKEIQALSWVFLGAELIDATHTGTNIPKGTKPLTALPSPINKVEADGQGVLVSHLRNGDKDFLMIVNRDIDHSQKVTIDNGAPINRILPDGTIDSNATSGTTTSVIAPGDYILFVI